MLSYVCVCVCVCVCVYQLLCRIAVTKGHLDNRGVCMCAQSRPTLCNSMDCSLPGSSVHEILQARILEWVAMSSSRGSSWPRDRICVSCVSCIGRKILCHCARISTIAQGKNTHQVKPTQGMPSWAPSAPSHALLFGGPLLTGNPVLLSLLRVFTEFFLQRRISTKEQTPSLPIQCLPSSEWFLLRQYLQETRSGL